MNVRRVVMSVVCLLDAVGSAFAQHRVDPSRMYARIYAIVPMIGSGTSEGPRRPMFASVPNQAEAGSRTGIIAFNRVESDDGKFALVEIVAANRLNGTSGVSEYLFTDSSGAQYHLSQNNVGVWSSLVSIYVSYDSNAGKLRFNDGSFWVMGSTSAGSDWDSGTMCPTLTEDSNGNEVVITYNAGAGVTWSNSSSRISIIEDVRGNGGADYTFTYNSEAIPHLTGITNTIGTAENYSFAYTENYALDSPFNSQHFGTVDLLESSTVAGIPLTAYLTYDTTSATTTCSGSGASGWSTEAAL